MKKSYSQPDIVFESFSLCASIAAGCGVKVGVMYNGECGLPYGNRVVFLEDVNGCTWKIQDGSKEFNGLCYHVPIDALSLFNS